MWLIYFITFLRMRLNLWIGLSSSIDDEEEPKNNKRDWVPWFLQNLWHTLSMSDESTIAYIEKMRKYSKIDNRFQIENTIVLIHKDNIFLYDKPTKLEAKDVQIIQTIPWVNSINDDVFQSEIIRDGQKAYIAYGFFPEAIDDVVYGYKIHMIEVDLKNKSMVYKKIIQAHNSDNDPKLFVRWDEFLLRTSQGTQSSWDVSSSQQTTTHQHYNPQTGESLDVTHH